MLVSDIAVDPKRFQFKLLTDAKTGVTNLLKGRRWNEELADPIAVWTDPADGKTYVVNGHDRPTSSRQIQFALKMSWGTDARFYGIPSITPHRRNYENSTRPSVSSSGIGDRDKSRLIEGRDDT